MIQSACGTTFVFTWPRVWGVLLGRLVEHFGGLASAASAGPASWRRVEGVGPKAGEAVAVVFL